MPPNASTRNGSYEPILQFLTPDFPAPIIIVQHLHPLQQSPAFMYAAQGSRLPCHEANEKETPLAGRVYFAPPNYHLLLELDHTFSLSVDAKVHYSRPSIDILFESAADAYGPALIGIVLSGANHDGADGLRYIKQRGGAAIVQTPESAEVALMPKAALQATQPDHLLAPDEIGPRLLALITE
jgi:two-component system chemotaxis response regulator CheB